MNTLCLFGVVDRRPEKVMVNPTYPKYLLTIGQEYRNKNGIQKRFVQVECGYPPELKEKAMHLNVGDQVVVTGYVKSNPSKDGEKFFTAIYANEVHLVGKIPEAPRYEDNQASSYADQYVPPTDPQIPF